MKHFLIVFTLVSCIFMSCKSQTEKFKEAFKNCEKAEMVQKLGDISYKYTILESANNEEGCRVQTEFIAHPNSDWEGKKMVCVLDNTLDLKTALQNLQNNMDCCNCQGELSELLAGEGLTKNSSKTNNQGHRIRNNSNWQFHLRTTFFNDINYYDSIIYLGSKAGILEIKLDDNQIGNSKIYDKASSGLPENDVLRITKGNEGEIWGLTQNHVFNLHNTTYNIGIDLNDVGENYELIYNDNLWVTNHVRFSSNRITDLEDENELKILSIKGANPVYFDDYFWMPTDTGLVKFDGKSNWIKRDTCCINYKLEVADNSLYAYIIYGENKDKIYKFEKGNDDPRIIQIDNPNCDISDFRIKGVYNEYLHTGCGSDDYFFNLNDETWTKKKSKFSHLLKDNSNNLWYIENYELWKANGDVKINLKDAFSVPLISDIQKTDGELNFWSQNDKTFYTYEDDKMSSEIKLDDEKGSIHNILKDNNEVWFINYQDDSYLLGYKTPGETKYYPVKKIRNGSDGVYSRIFDIISLNKDQSNNIWITTDDGRLSKFNENREWAYFKPFSNIYDNIEISDVKYDNKQSFYFATNKGLFKYNIKNKELEGYKGIPEAIDEEKMNEESSYTVNKIHLDNNSNIWLMGLIASNRVNLKKAIVRVEVDGKITTFNPGESNATNSYDWEATAVTTDNNGNTWISMVENSTYLRAVGQLTSEGKWKVFHTTQDSPLPNLKINDMQFDKAGKLWLSTGLGLVSFEPEL